MLTYESFRDQIDVARPEKITDCTELLDVALTPQAESIIESNQPESPVL